MDQTTNTQSSPGFTEPAPTYTNTQYNDPVISMKEWMINILLLAIPLVNIIMLFVWAFGGAAKQSLSNYAKAALLWAAIVIGLYIVFGVIVFGVLLSNFN